MKKPREGCSWAVEVVNVDVVIIVSVVVVVVVVVILMFPPMSRIAGQIFGGREGRGDFELICCC